MKACRGLWRLSVLFTAACCSGSLWGLVQPISGALFDPPLVPTTNAIVTAAGGTTVYVPFLDTAIPTYSVRLDNMMMGDLGTWRINSINEALGNLRGTLIRRSDFAGGTGDLGDIYGVRIEEPGGEFDPAVVGQWFGPPEGTLIFCCSIRTRIVSRNCV